MQKLKNLSDKHRRFCEEYIIDFNGAKAAVRAGYSKKTANRTAYRFLKDELIAQEVDRLKKKFNEALEERMEITIEWKMEKLKAIIDDAMHKMEDNNGLIKPTDLKAAISAIAELNKMQGSYAPTVTKQEHSGSIGVMSQEEIKARIDELTKVEDK